jgi:HEAT repeat protein
MAHSLTDLLEALADPDDATREEAAQALVNQTNAQTMESVTEALIEALEDEYWAVRLYVGHALAKIGGPRVIEVLIPMLGDLIKECRDGATQDFVTIGPAAVERLVAALRDDRWRVRESAARALGLIGDKRAVDGLIAALRDRDGTVRTVAAEALGRLGDPKAIKGLMALFKDTSKLVRVSATIALTQIGHATVEPLIESLKDENFQVRLHSVQALGGITSDYPTGRSWLQDSRPVPGLIALLKDKDRAVREDAAIALGMIGDPSAVPALIEALQDGQVKVRAIMALGMIGDTRAVEPLIRILEGIGIHQKGTPMPGCIVSEEWFIREEAAKTLGHINDLRSVPALLQSLKDTRLREKASGALVELGPQVIDQLVDFYNDPEASSVEDHNQNIMSFATNRLDAQAALRVCVLNILTQLGWTPPEETGRQEARQAATGEGAA